MKKTYTAPTISSTGSVIRETLGGSGSGDEFAKKPLNAGTVGYYL